MTRTTPLRCITLHLSHIFFTDGRTFISLSKGVNRKSKIVIKIVRFLLFTTYYSLFIPIRYPSAFQIVRRKLDENLIARQYANKILSHFA